MTQEGFKRKLTAILSADVAGYSRLMGDDEEATVRTITAYREILTNLIQQHNGKVVDSPGDNLLAEFVSVVDAVQCAVAVQKEIKARNDELPEHRKMEFRIGINLGDVIQEEDRIYGDGVNIAARLEGLSTPGGICISKTAFDHIESKLPYGYEFLGDQTVKNIAKPVGTYRVILEPRVMLAEVEKEKRVGIRIWKWAALAVVTILIIGAAVASIWSFYLRPSPPSAEFVSEKTVEIVLPEKPSIAVLPFVNVGDDPEYEYFSDGITEEIINNLSKVPQLFIIARNSVFTYKGTSVKVQQISRELGVKYVLEGSVRMAGDRVRITAQLVDATTGGHLWSERYDRDLKDIFSLQDEITMKILTAIRVKLTEGEQLRLYANDAENLDSYMKVLQGMAYFYRFNWESNIQARRIFEEAIALDTKNSGAYSCLGWTYIMEVWFGLVDSPEKSIEKAAELARKAQSLDDTMDFSYSLIANVYLIKRQYENAVAAAKRAVILNPNGADAHAHLGMILHYAGGRDEAISLFKKAIRLNPIPPNWYLFSLGDAYFVEQRYEEAIPVYERALHRNPGDIRALTGLAATYSMLGRTELVHATVTEILSLVPRSSVEYVKTLPFKNESDREHLIQALHQAGLLD